MTRHTVWFSSWVAAALAAFASTALAQGEEQRPQQPAAGAAPEVTDAKDQTPSDFARFVTVGDGGHFDVAVTTYRNDDGAELVLFGAVHIADAAHYRELQRRFAEREALLYELVGPEDYRPTRGEARGGFIAVLQNAMKTGLELEFQLDGVDYKQANFVHADMTPRELQESMDERGETLIGMLFQVGLQGQKAMMESGKEVTGMDVDLVQAFRSGEGRHRLRLLMASQLEMMEMMAAGAGEDGSTLLEGRNEKCLEVLQRELKAGRKQLGIYYGAAHLPHMERRLVEDLGFHKVDHEWLVAWDCTPRKDPVVDRELWAQRRQAKREIARIELAVGVWRHEQGLVRAGAPTFAQLAELPEGSAEPYYQGPRDDPWGHAYEIVAYTRRPYFDVTSPGQDGVAGTADDLHSASANRLRVMQRAQPDAPQPEATPADEVSPLIKANGDVQMIFLAAKMYRVQHGRWPTLAQLAAPDARDHMIIPSTDDPWGVPYAINTPDDVLEVRSAGPDGVFDTPDDIVTPAGR